MYKKTFEMKVIRTEHEITIYKDTRVVDLKKDLSHIPDEARLVETRDPEGDERVEVILVFQEDKEEKGSKAV